MKKYWGSLFLLVVGISILTSCMVKARRSSAVIGRPAPYFSLLDEQETTRSLSEFKGKKVALYFYPKSDTKHCTKQACSIRDRALDLRKQNIIVLGVSYDSPADNRHFKDKYHLPFSLLSDSNREVAKTYGAYGGFFASIAPVRMTFLINENGILIDIIKKVDVDNHAHQILEHFDTITSR